MVVPGARAAVFLHRMGAVNALRRTLAGVVFYLGLGLIGLLALPTAVLLGCIAGVWVLTDRLTAAIRS